MEAEPEDEHEVGLLCEDGDEVEHEAEPEELQEELPPPASASASSRPRPPHSQAEPLAALRLLYGRGPLCVKRE